MEGPVLTTNRCVMVGESAFKAPEGTDTVQDVGYSSESSAHLSDEAQERGTGYSPVRCLIEQAERLVRKEIKEERLSEVDSSCDASGEYTTNESDVEDSSGTDGWKRSLKIPSDRSYEGSVETVVASLDDGCQRCRKPRRKYGRPRSMTELYHRCSPDVPLFTSEVELNALLSPTSSCNRRCIAGVCSLPRYPRLRKPCPILQRSFTAATLIQWSDVGLSTRRRKSSSSSSGRDCYSSSNGHPSSYQLRKYSQPTISLQAEERSTGDENQSETDLDVTLRLEDYIVTQTTEDLSSVSDQVWDGYQDPLYLSEPYSEATADEDDLKKVTEFGDDYRDVIDVLSDTSSRPPTDIVQRSPIKPRSVSSTSTPQDSHHADSDSDVEEFHHIINETRRALHFAKTSIKHHTDPAPPSPAACAELIATCQTHLQCLQIVTDHLQRGEKRSRFSKKDLKQIQGLIRQWEMVQTTVDQPEQQSDEKEHDQQRQELQEKLEKLRQTMADLKYTDESPHDSMEELEKRINTLQMALCALQGTREQLLEINLTVHRRMTPSLKDNVTELYQQWDEIYEHNNGQLTTLQSLSNQWNEYQRRYKKLKERIHQEDIEEEQDCTEESHKTDFRQELKEIRKIGEGLQKQLQGGEPCQIIADELKELEDEVSLLREDSASEESFSHVEDASSKPEKKPVPSLFWRVLRAAVPIQLALVMLYCLACLLEPHCCDFVNNFNFSLTPQLRYIRGPPPV